MIAKEKALAYDVERAECHSKHITTFRQKFEAIARAERARVNSHSETPFLTLLGLVFVLYHRRN